MSAVAPRGQAEPRDTQNPRLGPRAPRRGRSALRGRRRRDRLHHRRRADLGQSRRRGRARKRKASADPRDRQSRRVVAAPAAQHHRDRRVDPRHRSRRAARARPAAARPLARADARPRPASGWSIPSDQFVYGQTGRHHARPADGDRPSFPSSSSPIVDLSARPHRDCPDRAVAPDRTPARTRPSAPFTDTVVLQMFLGRLAVVDRGTDRAADRQHARCRADADRADGEVPRRHAARQYRRPAAAGEPAHGQRPASRRHGDHVFDIVDAHGDADRALRLDAEAARRGNPPQRGPVPRHRARRLRAARRPGAALHAPHRRDHRRRREPAALPRAARSAVRAAQPQLLQRAAGSDHRRGQAAAARLPRCSTSTSTISRTSTTRSAIRSATS